MFERKIKSLKIGDKLNYMSFIIIVAYLAAVLTGVIGLTIVGKHPAGRLAALAALLVISAVNLFFIVRLTRIMAGSLKHPIKELKEAAHSMEAGRFDIDITYSGDDELGELADCFHKTCSFHKIILKDLYHIITQFSEGNFNVISSCRKQYVGDFKPVLEQLSKMVRTVSAALGTIRVAADQVAAGSVELARSAQGIAEGAENQASSVEELLITVTEVTGQVEENTRTTDILHDSAKVVGEEAEVSRQKMADLMTAMESIRAASQEINKIIADIEDIASQTNLLSLNAAIEAARAGEAGRGFAVVSDQIRKLAEDSALSAVKTKQLIEASMNEINKGNDITIDTAESMNKVIDKLDGILISVGEIRSASDRQAISVREIEKGVEQISEVVQNNSAVAQETSATSEELSAQALTLNEAVDKFELKGE